MPLAIALRPGEKVIINGAVISLDDRKGLFLYNHAHVLREREILRDDQAVTLPERLYLSIQLLYLFPADEQDLLVKFRLCHSEVSVNFPAWSAALAEINRLILVHDYYRALKIAAKLREEDLPLEYAEALRPG
ncbi:MAG TPA: flagellar biosynthesis repressor FlbT [Dongiaceae bacterium]|jgi:flagellar protein FlbT|nr:flagellar biosynthesis repressor FlbT [Dongiaceae bacterium]